MVFPHVTCRSEPLNYVCYQLNRERFRVFFFSQNEVIMSNAVDALSIALSPPQAYHSMFEWCVTNAIFRRIRTTGLLLRLRFVEKLQTFQNLIDRYGSIKFK